MESGGSIQGSAETIEEGGNSQDNECLRTTSSDGRRGNQEQPEDRDQVPRLIGTHVTPALPIGCSAVI